LIIAAVADTHGKTGRITERLRQLGPDHILFAGDFYKDGQSISRKLNIPTDIVAGNCDLSHRGKIEAVVRLREYKILLVHGHQYGVKKDLNRLYYRGRELEVDAIVFGHTHSPWCEQIGGMWLINPGSPVIPRSGGAGSFAIITIDAHGLQARILSMGEHNP
jgi:putative phosphoesterase